MRATPEEDAAFVDAVSSNLPSMLRLARRLGGQNAEDIVQEAIARAWAKRHLYDLARGALGPWLLAITADQAYKAWRWSRRHQRPTMGQIDADTLDDHVDLERSLARLPARQRMAVDLLLLCWPIGRRDRRGNAVLGWNS